MCPLSNFLFERSGDIVPTNSTHNYMPYLQSQPAEMLATSVRHVELAKSPLMAVQPVDGHGEGSDDSIRFIDLAYDNIDSDSSACELAYRVLPEWRQHSKELKITKFTDGITNTLLRIARRRPGASQDEIDSESVLMRAYGNNTDLIIDRDREAKSHATLAERGMAPPLLARFRNGLLYRYIPGSPCTAEDLTREPVWRGVAGKLGEWHARVPISVISSKAPNRTNGANGHTNGYSNGCRNYANGINGTNGVQHSNATTRQMLERRLPAPNFWTILQKWVDTLPMGTEKERARKDLLQYEIERTFQELDNKSGIGEQGLVFGHLDLLSGNVIMLPTQPEATRQPSDPLPVTFIDYEYATPCPAVFDIANHFAEWAGFDLDYTRIPTRSTRRGFLAEYLKSYNTYASVKVSESVLDSLEEDIDRWRGIPGLYWGIWAAIQAKISEIDFDYAQYSEDRLEEYWAWRAETSGTRVADGKAKPLREERWAQET